MKKGRIISVLIVIILITLSLNECFCNTAAIDYAEVTIAFNQSNYDLERRTNEPMNISIPGKVTCNSNAREVVVSLSVDAGSLSCSIEPGSMQFPRGSTEQPFTVEVVLTSGNPFNYSFIISVGGQYRYFPSPSLSYNIPPAETNVNIINASNEIPEFESEISSNEESSNSTIYYPIMGMIIIITIVVILIILRKRRSFSI